MILVVFRTVLLVQRPWTNLWKGRFINTNYYYHYYYTSGQQCNVGLIYL